ncbi:MAG: hypothetical protein H0S78_10470 [Tissierellales bacterium]|nr:hypothetical protein [Tissierellales bacterium]
MKKISIDYSKVLNTLNANDVYKMQEKVTQCHNMLHKDIAYVQSENIRNSAGIHSLATILKR